MDLAESRLPLCGESPLSQASGSDRVGFFVLRVGLGHCPPRRRDQHFLELEFRVTGTGFLCSLRTGCSQIMDPVSRGSLARPGFKDAGTRPAHSLLISRHTLPLAKFYMVRSLHFIRVALDMETVPRAITWGTLQCLASNQGSHPHFSLYLLRQSSSKESQNFLIALEGFKFFSQQGSV